MTHHLAHNVKQALALLDSYQYVSPQTEIRIQGHSQKTLLFLINDLRRRRGIATNMYASNLSTFLNYPNKAPPPFLEELTTSMGLVDLGFDETIWDDELPIILQNIRDAIAGGAMATVLKHGNNTSLFQIYQKMEKGILYPESRPLLTILPSIPEFTVEAGSTIQTVAHLPFPGFLRILACEEGEFIGLNRLLEISNGIIPIGKHKCADLDTTYWTARTIIYAFASTEPCFQNWPTTHQKAHRLKQGSILRLLNNFFSDPFSHRESSVQAFVTTAAHSQGSIQ